MTRRSLGLALAFVLSAGLGSADAQGWRGWLDRLSGPGPFDGVGVSAEFVCYGKKELRATGGQPEAQGALATTSGYEPFFDEPRDRLDCPPGKWGPSPGRASPTGRSAPPGT